MDWWWKSLAGVTVNSVGRIKAGGIDIVIWGEHYLKIGFTDLPWNREMIYINMKWADLFEEYHILQSFNDISDELLVVCTPKKNKIIGLHGNIISVQ